MAEREGFEPSVVLLLHTLSKGVCVNFAPFSLFQKTK